MSAAALAQRLRAGAVPGLNQAERNGWNGGTQPVSFQPKQAATEGEMPAGTDGTGGTGVFVGVCRNGEESRPKQAANDGKAPAPTKDPYAIGASWRPLAADYYRHHFGCKACCAAGRGHGTRCATGAELWATYEAASDAAHDTSTQGRRAR